MMVPDCYAIKGPPCSRKVQRPRRIQTTLADRY
jgi:hypothetical protein